MYLGIDTSTRYLCLGLWADDGFTDTIELEIDRDHTKRIITEIDKLLIKHALSKHDLKGVAVGIGPGSYTGIRVGIATAKGLARGLNLSIRGCSSLEAMAARVVKDSKAIIAVDARRDNVYYNLFEQQEGNIVELSEAKKESRENLKAAFPKMPWYEDLIPDASYIAQTASQKLKSDLSAIYL